LRHESPRRASTTRRVSAAPDREGRKYKGFTILLDDQVVDTQSSKAGTKHQSVLSAKVNTSAECCVIGGAKIKNTPSSENEHGRVLVRKVGLDLSSVEPVGRVGVLAVLSSERATVECILFMSLDRPDGRLREGTSNVSDPVVTSMNEHETDD
jgi:hypothetical protein